MKNLRKIKPDLKRRQWDLSLLGMDQTREGYPYFCTPKRAHILGWAGVDGIHFCTVYGFGEMVFAVSPMNPFPDYVAPLAYNFADFIRLLLACGDCNILEQAGNWTKEQFDLFLKENLLTAAQRDVLRKIRDDTGLNPMDSPWEYIKDLQTSFDYSKVPYSQDVYDVDMNPDAPKPVPQWRVTFDGNFWSSGKKGRPGKEVGLSCEFDWADRHWIVPALYLCGKGIVVDFCMRVDPERVYAFLGRWQDAEADQHLPKRKQMQMEWENPLDFQFRPYLYLNGKELSSTHGSSTCCIPSLPDSASMEVGTQMLEHYGLDPRFGWVFYRYSFPWATKRKPEMKHLAVSLIPETIQIPGPQLSVFHPGDQVSFSYRNVDHLLKVLEYEPHKLDWGNPSHPDWVYPEYFVEMTYTVTPPLETRFTVMDCGEGDHPHQIVQPPSGQPTAQNDAVVGIIGGADGPTAIFLGSPNRCDHGSVCSSLYFQPVEQVEWFLVFHEEPWDTHWEELF